MIFKRIQHTMTKFYNHGNHGKLLKQLKLPTMLPEISVADDETWAGSAVQEEKMY